MSDLTLTKQEIKELIWIRLAHFLGYLIAMSFLFFIYLKVLHVFTPRILSDEPFLSVLVFTIFSFGSFLILNKEYLQEIFQKRKRVYKGVLGIKTCSHNEYSFYMDGHVFLVGKEYYHQFKEGDLLEFHISPSTRHLFKVVRID